MNRNFNIPVNEIKEFSRSHHIRKLSLFGSVLRDDFGPDSDVDVLVEFEPDVVFSLFDLVRMQDELGALFRRKVDLVEAAGLNNPFRRYEILRTHRAIYAV